MSMCMCMGLRTEMKRVHAARLAMTVFLIHADMSGLLWPAALLRTTS